MDISLKHLRMIASAINVKISAMKIENHIYGTHGKEIEEYEKLAEMIGDLILKQ